MALVTLAKDGAAEGFPVAALELNLPRVGAWTATVLADSQGEDLSGKLDLLIGATRLKGKVTRGGLHGGMFQGRVIAGGAGLETKVQARHYISPTIGIVLADIARDAGEAVSPTASAAVTGTQLDFWTTLAIPAGQAIRCLMELAAPETVWRHLPDGTLWFGVDAFADSGIVDFAELDERPADGVVEVQLTTPLLFPGTLLGERRVDSAQIRVGGGEVRATVWAAD